jgi:formamidopyrimidine-DNA glycosylase
MPELPDVEAFRRSLSAHALGERIASVRVRDAAVVRGRSSQDFAQQLIHPSRRFRELDPRERRELGSALQSVLRASVEAGRSHGGVRGSHRSSRSDPRCPRCRSDLRKERIAGRSSYWCPGCQPPDGNQSRS